LRGGAWGHASLSHLSWEGIVFVANPSRSWQLYIINPDGNDMTQVTTMASTALESWDPVFSADGKTILFNYGQLNSNGVCQCDLYTINPDGSDLTQLTKDGPSQFGHWSPDASGSFWLGQFRKPVNGFTTMRSDGTGKRTKLTGRFWLSVGNAYTPDGRKIVFDSQQGGLVSAVWRMTTKGKDQRRLTRVPLEGCLADVSPDGLHFLTTNHCNADFLTAQMFQANVNGGKDFKQLTFSPKVKADLAWGYSPDGTKIVFISTRMSSNLSLDLYTANSDGTDIGRIASGLTVGGCPDGNCVTPSWGPQPKKRR